MDNLFNDVNDDNLDIEDHEVDVDELIGEGKKFKDVATLAKGKLESDRFIDQLKGELRQLREELNSRLSLTELVDKLKTQPESGQETSNRNPQDVGERVEKPEDVKKLIDDLLSQRDAKSRVERNKELVKQELTKQFGPAFNKHVKAKADELGMTLDDMNDLAVNRPQVLLGLFKGSQSNVDVALPETQVNTASLMKSQTGKVRDQAYYSALRKQVGDREYFSPKVQNQLYKDRVALGDRFNSR